MNEEKFLEAYNQSRNGADYFVKYLGGLVFSSGVHEVAKTGTYWLLDIVATEVVPLVKRTPNVGILYVLAKDSRANLRLEFDDDHVSWAKAIKYTDLPNGEYKFVLQQNGDQCVMILLSEY